MYAVVNLTKQSIKTELFYDNWLFYYCEEMKVFLSAFRLLSKVKAAILTTRTWYLSSDMPTRKYEKTNRANEIYKSELGLPIIPTSTERRIRNK